MSIDKQPLNKGKIAAGAAMVALSGFVPQPAMQQAEAASVAISVTGSLITGIQLTAGTPLKFGKLVVTASTGSVSIAPAAGTVASSNAKVVSGQQVGDFKLALAVTGAKVDATIANINLVDTLVATGGGSGPVKSSVLKIEKIYIDGAKLTGGGTKVTFAGGTTVSVASAFGASTATTQTINVGGVLSWGAGQPIGAFTQSVNLILNF